MSLGITVATSVSYLQWAIAMALLIQRLVVVAEKAPNVLGKHRCNGFFYFAMDL